MLIYAVIYTKVIVENNKIWYIYNERSNCIIVTNAQQVANVLFIDSTNWFLEHIIKYFSKSHQSLSSSANIGWHIRGCWKVK